MNKLNFSIHHWVKLLIKGWIKMIKKGLLKRLRNIKDTNLTQLQAIRDQGEK